MKNINQLKSERASLIEKMEVQTAILKDEKSADEARNAAHTEFTSLDEQVKSVSKDIDVLERQEELNKIASVNIIVNKPTSERGNFFRALGEMIDTNGHVISSEFKGQRTGGIVIPQFMYRADPLLTTTDAGLVGKQVGPVDIILSDAEQWLRNELGATIINLGATQTFGWASEPTGGRVDQGSDGSTASLAPVTITLSPVGYTFSQTWSKELQAVSNPSLVQDMIVKPLYDALWYAAGGYLFTDIATDAATSVKTHAGGQLTHSILSNFDVSLGSFVKNPKWVAGLGLQKALRSISYNSTYGVAPVLDNNNMVLGRKVIASSIVPSTKLFYGDMGAAVVAMFGQPELIIDPYTYASSRKIKVVVDGMFDSGFVNPRKVVFITDASSY